MARATLIPVLISPQNPGNLSWSSLTAIAAAGTAPNGTGTGNGVQFPNYPGQTLLLVSTGGTATTPTIAAGQLSAAVALSALPVNSLGVLGAFYSAMLLAGTQNAAVDFSSVTAILCAAIQLAPVF